MSNRAVKDILGGAVTVVAGALAILLVGFLSWAGIHLPLNVRFPVPSPDSHYLAYFDRVPSDQSQGERSDELVIATREGERVAEFPLSPGPLVWSGADHLVAVNPQHHFATLLPNLRGQFLILATLPIAPGSSPAWSRDGTKLAYVSSSPRGDELRVYYVQQAEEKQVPLGPGFHLSQADPLFWSPVGDELYLLNAEAGGIVLDRVQIQTGDVQTLARANYGWESPHLRVPQASPEGSRIYLPAPLNSVISASTGEVLWTLPPSSSALWSVWSANDRVLYAGQDGRIEAHDFTTQTDQPLLWRVPSNGFFSADLRNYFFRTEDGFSAADNRRRLRFWMSLHWGWQHLDVPAQTAQPLGRVELWPWAQTQDGLIEAREDDYTGVRYGLYDPNARSFSAYVLPTAEEDFAREVKSRSVILVTVALYGALGFFVFLRLPKSSSARALALISFVLMASFSSADTFSRWVSFEGAAYLAAQTGLPGVVSSYLARGWLAWPDMSWLPLSDTLLSLTLLALSLFPPALLHFAVVFPEGNHFLGARRKLAAWLCVVAFLPFAVTLLELSRANSLASVRPAIQLFSLLVGTLALCLVLAALLYNFRHPLDRRARLQVRWVALAIAVPLAGLGVLMLTVVALNWIRSGVELSPLNVFDSVFTSSVLAPLGLFTPAAIGYALAAPKLPNLGRLLRRVLWFAAMSALAVAVYLLLIAGLSWLNGGSFSRPSTWVVVVAALVTASALFPLLGRVGPSLEQAFDRPRMELRDAIEKFGEGLPNILDRATLATRIQETLRLVLKFRASYLLTLDRARRCLRPQPAIGPAGTRQALPRQVAEVAFDPSEPLCRYLVEDKRAFEVEVSPYHPKLIPILRGAGDRLARLEAEIVLGLVHRGELLGMMTVGGKESDDYLSSEEIALLEFIARQATVAVEYTDLFEEVAHDREVMKELEVASEVQAHLFPTSVPRSLTCQIAGRCVPTRSVSGDYYDFLELPGKKIGLAIADVSGRGVPASLLIVNLQGVLRAQAPTVESPAELTRRINRQLFVSFPGAKYCSFFYGVYDEASRHLDFVNAGHNPPLVLPAEAGLPAQASLNPGAMRLLESTGVPLGLFPEVSHEVKTEALDPGTLVVLYSDGITEARNSGGNAYGVDRLVGLVSREREKPAEELVDRILEDVRAFSGDTPSDDDQTLVVLKVNPA
ncbi:MAG: hypothetical protein DMG22_06065 [Acidobacteria bacterium]|nr:MAG: hypothetical protein DMG22_06065 [Acidobacteriota bacterium]